MGDNKTGNYAACDHIERPAIDWTVDQDLINSIATEYRTLPTFEHTFYEHTLRKHYSLQTNKLLKCRWEQYKSTYENKVFEPFEFPAPKDLHFYNGTIRFLPNLTLSRQKFFKMQMKSGPGIDFKGQMYIPYELYMKRGISEKEVISKRAKAGESKKKEKAEDGKAESKDEKETKKGEKVPQKNLKKVKNIKETKKDIKVIKNDTNIDKKDIKLAKKDAKAVTQKDVKGTEKDVKINGNEDKNKEH